MSEEPSGREYPPDPIAIPGEVVFQESESGGSKEAGEVISCGGFLAEEDMPDDRGDLRKYEIHFPHLDDEQTARHPEFVTDLLDYLRCEGEEIKAGDLHFVRSALVDGEMKYWLFEFDDEYYYAWISEDPKGIRYIGFDESEGLTPEQAMLADYHQCY